MKKMILVSLLPNPKSVTIGPGFMCCSMKYDMVHEDVELSVATIILIGILAVFEIGLLVCGGCSTIYVAALLLMQDMPEVTKKIKSAWDNLKYPNAVSAAACCCSLLLSVRFLYLFNEACKILIKHEILLFWFVYSAPYSLGFINSLSVAAFCVGGRRFINFIDSCVYKDAPTLDE
ncbi:hypothetical protein COLO4_25573 [Corchorus olitorius]|uniref:Uncharacterized protein n=1 Tax=Corchorus olitorius TaxID=93759 RepID=A0A1R3I1E9_9ROSI|nr:hypothetical protein COLO4_25573 [Corchorus olitorius]